MPTGVYEHRHVGYRPPPACVCGQCRRCKRRGYRAKYYASRPRLISDAELERRLIEKFLKEGWDPWPNASSVVDHP